jgi:hypothetical protein
VRNRRRILLTLGVVAVGVALAVPQGLRQHVGEDFAVFWQAGRNFATGAPLYDGYLPGARPLKYPPFAALVCLTALLLSPITFTTHLVPLLFVFAVALSIRPEAIRGPARVLALVICLGMAASGLSGRDLVSRVLAGRTPTERLGTLPPGAPG